MPRAKPSRRKTYKGDPGMLELREILGHDMIKEHFYKMCIRDRIHNAELMDEVKREFAENKKKFK